LSSQNNYHPGQYLSRTNGNLKKIKKSVIILKIATIRKVNIECANKPLLAKISPKKLENVPKKRILSLQIIQNKQLKQYL
jgi:hypothetical protein